MGKEGFMNKKLAFTLSELIIVVSIIGVVAAITTPSVIANHQRQSMLLLLKKTYAELEQNLTLFSTKNYKGLYKSSLSMMSQVQSGANFCTDICSIYGADSKECEFCADTSAGRSETGYKKIIGRSRQETVGAFFDNYYTGIEVCGTTPTPCFASKYSNMSNANKTDFTCARGASNDPVKGYSVRLSSGVAICIVPADVAISEAALSWEFMTSYRFWNSADKTYSEDRSYLDIAYPSTLRVTESGSNAVVYIDVNGPNTPNIGGKDMFTFNIYNDYSIDELDSNQRLSKTERETFFNNNCKTSPWGKGCFNKILLDKWKIKY